MMGGEMNENMMTFKIAMVIINAVGGIALLALVLHLMAWAPFLVSVSWNA